MRVYPDLESLQRYYSDSIFFQVSLTSRICASRPGGSAKTRRKENYASDKRSEPADLHDGDLANTLNNVQLKGYFAGLTQLL